MQLFTLCVVQHWILHTKVMIFVNQHCIKRNFWKLRVGSFYFCWAFLCYCLNQCYDAVRGVRKSIQPVKIDWWVVGMVIRLDQGADRLHVVQTMPLPSQNPTISWHTEFQNGFVFLIPSYPDSLERGWGGEMCVCCFGALSCYSPAILAWRSVTRISVLVNSCLAGMQSTC